MAGLIDFVVAKNSEMKAVVSASSADPRWKRWDCKGIDHVLLGRLDAVIAGTAYDPGFAPRCEMVAEASEDGPWLFRVPSDCVDRLCDVGEDNIPELSRRWALAPEFRSFGRPEEAAAHTLGCLLEAGRMSRKENAVLFMWMCL